MMVKSFLFLLLVSEVLCAKYFTNKDCNECHENIYEEYQYSYHAKTYFNDKLHRKVANHIPGAYDCASCHMPSANNLQDLLNNKAKPNKTNKTHTDAISCFYCHQIAFVKKAHIKNKIILTKQVEGYKPTIYGSLKNPEETDKHTMTHSPIYDKYVCTGCHSHKRNSHDVLIFDAMHDKEDSHDCIKCHMPKIAGSVEDMNKKARKTHYSHKFLGIHDATMRSQGVDINISATKNTLKIVLTNKTSHPLIIQPARLKYLKITIKRDKKIIWQNYKKSPKEDKQGSFFMEFVDKNQKPVSIPAFAYKKVYENNLYAKQTKKLVYKTPQLQKNDHIEVALYVILAKQSCAKAIDLHDLNIINPLLMKKCNFIVLK